MKNAPLAHGMARVALNPRNTDVQWIGMATPARPPQGASIALRTQYGYGTRNWVNSRAK